MSVIELTRESAYTATLRVSGISSLTGAQIIFYLKHKADLDEPDESSYLFKKATANAGGSDDQIKIIDADNCIAEIYFKAEDTKDLEILTYAYRYRVKVIVDDEYVVLSDKLRLKP